MGKLRTLDSPSIPQQFPPFALRYSPLVIPLALVAAFENIQTLE
jgi:hypothetical protein